MVSNLEHERGSYWVVKRVHDGDTVDFVNPYGVVLRGRLYGEDAPEIGQVGYGAARRMLSALLAVGPLEVTLLAGDAWGREVVRVVNGAGVDCSRAMVAAGLAWWYRRYNPRDMRLAQAEREAKDARRGIWARGDNIAPWAWRRGVRERRPGVKRRTGK